MTNENDFFTDKMTFSFSNINTYNQCPHGWKLTYYEGEDRIGNWYGQFGNLCHDIMEKFMTDELDLFDLSQYFADNYTKVITASPPPFPAGLPDRYSNEIIEFLDGVSFDKNILQPLSVEKFMGMEIGGVKVTAKPDLLYRDTVRNKIVLADYKTSNPFGQNKKLNKKKIEEYKKQLLLYTYAIKQSLGIEIDELMIWFLRYDEQVFVPFTQVDVDQTLIEFVEGVNLIKSDKEFPPKVNQFFCQQLCGVSAKCQYKPIYVPKTEWQPEETLEKPE
jgi:CRISPR/Cas system-associated exonuclease Cas4 (RecB family)